MKLLSHGY
ncbi:sensory box protein, partial [Yersinia pestis PY-19]